MEKVGIVTLLRYWGEDNHVISLSSEFPNFGKEVMTLRMLNKSITLSVGWNVFHKRYILLFLRPLSWNSSTVVLVAVAEWTSGERHICYTFTVIIIYVWAGLLKLFHS